MWKCNKCGMENEESIAMCQQCGEAQETVEIDAEVGQASEASAKRKRNRVIGIVLAGIVVLGVIAVIFSSLSKPDNFDAVTYNQVMESNPEITEEGVAFEVNGMAVDDVAWNYYFMAEATGYANGLGVAVDDVKWDKKGDNGEIPLETVKYDAMKAIVSNAAAVSLAEEWGIELTTDELNIIDIDLDYWKQVYGKDVYKELNMKDEENYRKIYKDLLLQRKVIETVGENPEKYLKGVKLEKYANNQSATVKIIGINKGEDETTAERMKAKIETIKTRLDGGEAFDKLWLENYLDTTGMELEEPTVERVYKDGSLDKEIEEGALALKIGETSGVIESDYSYAIVTRIAGYTEVENYIMDESDVHINKNLIESTSIK